MTIKQSHHCVNLNPQNKLYKLGFSKSMIHTVCLSFFVECRMTIKISAQDVTDPLSLLLREIMLFQRKKNEKLEFSDEFGENY